MGVDARRLLGVLSAATVLVLAACQASTAPLGAPAPSASGWRVLAELPGAVLDQVTLAGGGTAYRQRIDIRRMRIDQVLGKRDESAGSGRSAYHPDAPSPYFERITLDQAQRECLDRYGSAAFSVVNFSFFEEYQRSTRLSFPIKVDGAVVSGGSSPWGPVTDPRDPYYRTVTLRALTWSDEAVTVAVFDPATGAPLIGFADGLVSYLYSDHPSVVLGGDPRNRYQVLGALDADGSDGAETLVIVTVVGATLAQAAAVLRDSGVTGDVVTFDGGVSTTLWSAATGALVSATTDDQALPHYLCVHRPEPGV